MARLHCTNITPCRTLHGRIICVDYRTLLNKGAKDNCRLILINHFVTPLVTNLVERIWMSLFVCFGELVRCPFYAGFSCTVFWSSYVVILASYCTLYFVVGHHTLYFFVCRFVCCCQQQSVNLYAKKHS